TPSDPLTRCPRSSLHPRPEHHHWLSPAPTHVAERLRDIPCRRADRSGIPARSSPFDTVCSEVPELYPAFPDLRQSPVLPSFTNTPDARVLPSTGVTRLHRYL